MLRWIQKGFLFVSALAMVLGFNNCKLTREPSGPGITSVGNPPKKSEATKVTEAICARYRECAPNQSHDRCFTTLFTADQLAEPLQVPLLGVNSLEQTSNSETLGTIIPNTVESMNCLKSIQALRCTSLPPTQDSSQVRKLLFGPEVQCGNFYRPSDDIYSIAGESQTMLAEIYTFLFETFKWDLKGSLPEPRTHFSVTQGLGRSFLIGGWDGQSAKDSVLISADNFVWTPYSGLPKATLDFPALRFRNQFWVLGGRTTSSMPTGHPEVFRTSDFQKYSTGPNLPKGLFGHRAFIFEDELFVIGGASDNTSVSAEIFKLNASEDAWVSIGRLPAPRYGGLVVQYEKNIYLIGGRDPSHTATRDIFISADGINWRTHSFFPKNLAYGDFWVKDGFVYVFSDDSIYRTNNFTSWQGVGNSPTQRSLGYGFVGPLTRWSIQNE